MGTLVTFDSEILLSQNGPVLESYFLKNRATMMFLRKKSVDEDAKPIESMEPGAYGTLGWDPYACELGDSMPRYLDTLPDAIPTDSWCPHVEPLLGFNHLGVDGYH